MTLELLSGQGTERNLSLDRLPVTIGRSPDVEVQIDDYWVSRYHCRIDRAGGFPEIRDLGSRTGTFVNGIRVTRACLHPGDVVTLGRTKIRTWYEPL